MPTCADIYRQWKISCERWKSFLEKDSSFVGMTSSDWWWLVLPFIVSKESFKWNKIILLAIWNLQFQMLSYDQVKLWNSFMWSLTCQSFQTWNFVFTSLSHFFSVQYYWIHFNPKSKILKPLQHLHSQIKNLLYYQQYHWIRIFL